MVAQNVSMLCDINTLKSNRNQEGRTNHHKVRSPLPVSSRFEEQIPVQKPDIIMEETELDAPIPVTVLYSDTTAPDTSLPPRDVNHSPVYFSREAEEDVSR